MNPTSVNYSNFDFHPNPILNMIQKKLHIKNQNFIGVVVGKTGTGKSLSALRMAELIDPTFNITNIVFTIEAFMTLLVEGKKEGKIHKGSVIIFDEAGVGIPARDWQSQLNKVMGFILQTFRVDNVCLLFTVPVLSFIDVNARKLMHMKFKTKYIDRLRNYCALSPKEFDYNEDADKIYTPYYIEPKTGRKVKELKLSLPSAKLLEQYDNIQKEYKSKLQESILKDIREQMDKKAVKKEKKDDQTIADDIIKDIEQFQTNSKYVKKDRGKYVLNKKVTTSTHGCGEHIYRKVNALVSPIMQALS